MFGAAASTAEAAPPPRHNVLFIVADDLTLTALSCYGNTVCKTPNIDRLAARGTRFTHAYCQGTYCGPSRASFLSGYYPHATGVLGYVSPRKAIGERATWPQHFKNADYYTARVSKIFHMGVPGGIEAGTDGEDDPASWTERFNSPGPEWKAAGIGETLEGNPDGKKPVVGGNTFVVVAAEDDDLVHSDGKTAAKACELIEAHKNESFFLGVGFVRPHVPFVSPKAYHEPYSPTAMVLPEKVPGDWDDIPKLGINYKTSENMKMNEERQRKAVAGYYAAVAFMDAQVGKVLDALDETGLAKNTIVVFWGDHGWHLGDHGQWCKHTNYEQAARIPVIVAAPEGAHGKTKALIESVDIYPTLCELAALPPPSGLDGRSFAATVRDASAPTKESIIHVYPRGKDRMGRAVRDARYRFVEWKKPGAAPDKATLELYDYEADPLETKNLAAERPEIVARMRGVLAGHPEARPSVANE